MKLTTVRRIYQIFFLALFLFFVTVTDFKDIKGYPVSLFLEMDPLNAIAGFFSGRVLYRGLIWSLVIIVLTLFLGRIFCSWICPMGVIHHLAGSFYDRRKVKDKIHGNRYRRLYQLKYLILIAFIILAALGSLQVGLLDPIAFTTRAFATYIWPVFSMTGLPVSLRPEIFEGAFFIGLLFLAVVAANRWIRRFWCRSLCPLGALLGLLATTAPCRIQRDTEKCINCGLCASHCQGACEPDGDHRVHECHVCLNCVEICPEDAVHYRRSRDEAPERGFSLSRRKLLGGLFAGAAFFTFFRSTTGSANKVKEDLIRPPGSLPEQDFLRKCIKCGQCMRVCPSNGLHPTLLEAGLEGIWTPHFIMEIGYCEYNCNLCGRVCPTGAIRNFSISKKLGQEKNQEPIRIGTAFFDRGRCLPWAMDTECIVCEEVCPTSPKAIWFEKEKIIDRNGNEKILKRPRISPELCIGCGICEKKCPITDKAAVRVTSVGESRSEENVILLSRGKSRNSIL